MWRGVTSFNGSVYVLNIEINEWLNFSLSCFDYKPDESDFFVSLEKNQIFKLCTTKPTKLSCCLGFEVLLDCHCGVFLPFFIALFKDICYLFCFDSYEWVVKYYFQVPKISGQKMRLGRGADFKIANGPTIVWLTGDEILIYKAEYSFVNNIDCVLRVSIDTGVNVMSGNILWWNSGHIYPSDQSECGFITVIVKKDTTTTKEDTYLISINKENRSAKTQLTSSVIPPVYLQVMTCCCPFGPSHMVNKMVTSVFICTNQCQLLEFVNGQYIKHVNIPLSGCKMIKPFECHTGGLILFCSQEDQVCAVDWTTRQILRNLSNFNNLIVDDFIGKGTEQALLISGHSGKRTHVFEEFILLDFIEDDIKKNKSENPNVLAANGERGDSSMAEVFLALDQKVKAAETSIIACRVEQWEKSSFIKKHCDVLQRILMKRNPIISYQSPSLASLFDGPIVNCDEGLSQKSSKLAVISKRQNLYNTTLVVRLEVENVGESPVSDISLWLVNERCGIISSYSKTHETPRFHLSSQTNKETFLPSESGLTPGQKLIITCTCNVPDFTCERHFNGGLMLSWKQKENGNHFAQFCGEVVVTVDDFLPEEEEKPFQIRICHLSISLVESQVLISTPSNSNEFLLELLKSKMDVCGLCKTIISMETKYRLKLPGLSTVHVILESVRNGVIMRIFTRDYSQLYLALWSLKKHLPDDVRWSPYGNRNLVNNAITCVKEEVISKIRRLESLLESKLKITEEVILINVKKEEIPKKRRKLSQVKEEAQKQHEGRLDLCDCLTTFYDICHCTFVTEKMFKTLMLMVSR